MNEHLEVGSVINSDTVARICESYLEGMKSQKQVNDFKVEQGESYLIKDWKMDRKGQIFLLCEEINTGRKFEEPFDTSYYPRLQVKSRRLKRAYFKRYCFRRNVRIDPILTTFTPVQPFKYFTFTVDVAEPKYSFDDRGNVKDVL